MRRFVVGTAGHVDHGKTTLVRALTGVDTDRLPEEKRRGITIELGFAPLSLDGGLEVSLIDVPGHRKLVHTMIAGAAGIELVLLVVAADEGVMPQTREHLAACELLGIRHAVVALTKVDRVERELGELAAEEISELLRGRFEHSVVPCSAKTGEGIDALRSTLASRLSALPARAAFSRARLGVDRVFTVRGAGTVVTGTLVGGTLEVGQTVRIVGASASLSSTVRGLHVHDRAVDRAEGPTRLALNLQGIAVSDLARGDVVTDDSDLEASRRLDLEISDLADFRARAQLDVYVGAARSAGRVQGLAFARDEPGEAGATLESEPKPRRFVRLRLDSPLAVTGGDRVVLRLAGAKGPSGAVVGGGRVLDARAPRIRSRAARRAVLDAASEGDATTLARAVVRERAPRAVASTDLAARFPVEATAMMRALEKAADRGEIVRLRDGGFVDRDAVTLLARRARSLVGAHHDAHPIDPGMRLETLRQKLAERAGLAVALESIRMAGRKSLEGPVLLVEGDIARLEGFVEGRGRAPTGPLEAAVRALEEAALKGLGEFAMVELLALPTKEAKAVLAKLVRDGVATHVGGQWFCSKSVDALRARVVEHFASNDVLTIAAFKDLSGLGRKQAIPLLELLDRDVITVRVGDDRKPGTKARTAR
jgi:selenocysteine-specific elongation factor